MPILSSFLIISRLATKEKFSNVMCISAVIYNTTRLIIKISITSSYDHLDYSTMNKLIVKGGEATKYVIPLGKRMFGLVLVN